MNTLSVRGILSTSNLEIYFTQKKILRMAGGATVAAGRLEAEHGILKV